ncbi:hydrophobic surface binding protein, partial [Roridomyces roridus]
MVQISRFLALASLIATGFTMPAKGTLAQLEADIATTLSELTSLYNQIDDFPQTGLYGARKIDASVKQFIPTLNKCTADIKTLPLPISEADGNAILTSLEPLQAPIFGALTDIIDKKAGFAALPVPGFPAIILQDLKNLNVSVPAFWIELISVMPDDLKSPTQDILAEIVILYNNSIDAYEDC